MLEGSGLKEKPCQTVYKFPLGEHVCALQAPVILFDPMQNSGINKPISIH